MDFEIEGSEDESYHYESYSNPASYSSGRTLGMNPPKKSSTYFGGGDEDDNAYDFEYEEPPAPKGPTAGHFSAFSPEAKTRKSLGKAATPNDSTDYSEEDSGYHPTKSNAAGGNNNNGLRLSMQSNESALERAQNMLNKYNNNSKSSAPSSNFKHKRMPTTFDEDDLSMEEELEDSAVEISDSMDQSSGMKRSGAATNLHKPAAAASYKAAPAPAASISKPTNKAANSKPMKFHDESTMSNIVGEESVEDVYSEVEDIVEEEVVDDDEHDEDAEEEYENEDFDDADELGESIAHDDDDDDVKFDKPTGTKTSKAVAKKQIDSEDEDQVNHSYSRMVYGPEDGIDSDEVDEDVTETSKPKIFSFAELGDIAGWEPNTSTNIANKSDFLYPELPSTQPVVAQPKVSSSTTAPKAAISVPTSTKQPEPKVIVPSHKPAVSAPAPAPTSEPVVSVAAPTYSAPPPAAHHPHQHVPPSSSSAHPSAHPHHNHNHQPAQYPPYPQHPQYPPQPLPQHYPYAYPPAPSASGDAGQTQPAAHYPPPSPYGYPQYPPYPHMAPPPPYGYPYGYPYPPMPPMHYPPYPYPQYHYPPVDGMGALNQQASLLASLSASASINKSSAVPSSPIVSQMQNQPIILELLQELSKVQEEANWARKKLAETIVMLNHNPNSNRASVEVSSPTLALPKHGAEKGRYPQDEEDDDDNYEEEDGFDSNEYSEDFEVSNLNLSTSFRKQPSGKGRTNKKTIPNDTFKKVDHHKPVEVVESKPTDNVSPPYLPKQSENVRFSQDLQQENKVRGLGIPSFTTTNEFLDPFTDSVARSFLASQELLRSKLESLRLRVQMTNSMSSERQELENFAMGVNKQTQGSSLDKLKAQFETKRKQSEERLIKLLKEAYPNLDEAEALRMSKMIE